MASAAFSGTNFALRTTPVVGTWPRAAHSNDRVYCMSDECFATSTGTTGSNLDTGILPRGANVLLTVIWPIDSDSPEDGGNAMNAAVTGQLGITGSDIDLFGDVAVLTTATPQVIEPGPDGTLYTSTLDFALQDETSPSMLTAAQSIVDTEGIAVKILYTRGGRTV